MILNPTSIVPPNFSPFRHFYFVFRNTNFIFSIPLNNPAYYRCLSHCDLTKLGQTLFGNSHPTKFVKRMQFRCPKCFDFHHPVLCNLTFVDLRTTNGQLLMFWFWMWACPISFNVIPHSNHLFSTLRISVSFLHDQKFLVAVCQVDGNADYIAAQSARWGFKRRLFSSMNSNSTLEWKYAKQKKTIRLFGFSSTFLFRMILHPPVIVANMNNILSVQISSHN